MISGHAVRLTPRTVLVGVSITMSLSQGGSRQQVQDEESGLSDAEDGDDPAALGRASCLGRRDVYVDSGNEKKVLYLLCIGLNRNDDQPLFSFDREPWSVLPKNSSARPRNTDYVNEIKRRADSFNIIPVPRANNWKRAQIMEWLERNPVRDGADIEFLKTEVVRLENVLIRSTQDHSEMRLSAESRGHGSGGGRGHWRGSVPYLRIIMCLTQDSVKCLFLTRADTRSRQELDARNSDVR